MDTYVLLLSILVVQRAMETDMNRVIGGHDVHMKQYPFVAVILFQRTMCTGSIITRSWVITAGHCCEVEPSPARVHIIKVGLVDINSRDFPHMQRRRAERVVRHPKYQEINDGSYTLHDIALMKVRKQFDFNKYVGRVGLAVNKPPYRATNCYGIGFGVTYDMTVGKLHRLRIKNETSCRSISRQLISSHILCTLAGKSNVTQLSIGDSGGPMMCGGVLVGVFSSFEPDRPQVVQAHMIVPHFRNWILGIVPEAKFYRRRNGTWHRDGKSPRQMTYSSESEEYASS